MRPVNVFVLIIFLLLTSFVNTKDHRLIGKWMSITNNVEDSMVFHSFEFLYNAEYDSTFTEIEVYAFETEPDTFISGGKFSILRDTLLLNYYKDPKIFDFFSFDKQRVKYSFDRDDKLTLINRYGNLRDEVYKRIE